MLARRQHGIPAYGGSWVGAIEPQFYAELRRVLGIEGDARLDAQFDPALWPAQKVELARLFKTKTRAEWIVAFDQAEACVTPVLSMAEALEHPHNITRGTFVAIDGVLQPAPAPRFKSL